MLLSESGRQPLQRNRSASVLWRKILDYSSMSRWKLRLELLRQFRGSSSQNIDYINKVRTGEKPFKTKKEYKKIPETRPVKPAKNI